MLSISALAVETKTIEVDFPGIAGFKVKLNAVTREVSRKISKASTVAKFEPGSRVPINTIDDDLFAHEFAKAAISGWSGLTYEGLSNLLVIGDITGKEDEIIDYSPENAAYLIKNSNVFEGFVNSVVFNIQSFRS